MPAFGDIEEQEIGSIVEKIVKPVGLVKGDGGIGGMIIQGAFDTRALIGENVFGMVEIDFKTPAFLFIQKKSQAIVVLRDRQRLFEQPFIPAFVIVRPDMYKIIIVAQGWLRDMYRAMGIPFGVITP